jgi:hypothetical protein
MTPRIRLHAQLVAVVAAGLAAGLGGAAAPLSAAASDATVVLPNSAMVGLGRATFIRPTDPTTVIGLGVELARPNPSGEAARTHAEYDPSSPLYHQFLTPAEFNAEFGVSPAASQALVDWLRGGGLSVQTIPGTTDYVLASGSVAQVEQLLSVRFDDFSYKGEQFYAATSQPTVPRRLGIEGITGLNDAEGPRLLPHHETASATPAAPVAGSNMGETTPFDLWSIYDEPSQDKGDGEQMAIFGWGTTNNTRSDLRQFEREYHFPAMPFSVRYYGTEKKVTDSSGEGEWNIDTQASSGMSPDAAAEKLYFGKAGTDPDLIGAYKAWVNDANGPHQGSSSFSGCEEAPGTDAFSSSSGVGSANGLLLISNAAQDQYESALRQAVAEGRTMFASTGDTGSGCPISDLVVNGATIVPTLQQGYPAISPNAVGVGGTVLYWNGGGSSPLTGATATRSFEYTWTHGGGGTSLFLAAGDYQQGVLGVVAHCIVDNHGNPYVPPAPLCRGGPDVSAQSGDVTGNGYTVTSSGTNDTQGAGTSLSSPLWLGMWTRIQAASPKPAGNGFANEALYAIGKDPTKYGRDFFDIGQAGVPTTAPSCNGIHCSHNGWDYTSGLGTPNVTGLMLDIDGTTRPRAKLALQGIPPVPVDNDTHGGVSCPGPQIVADDPSGTSDANTTPGGQGEVSPNYDLVKSWFSNPDAKTLRVTMAVADLEGSPSGTADANLGSVFLSTLWNMSHSESGHGSTVTYTNDTVKDTSRTGKTAWTTNEWAGGTVTVDGMTEDVVSSDTNSLTTFDAWPHTPRAGSTFHVTAETPYFAVAQSTGPGPAATWSFAYGQYDGNLFDNQIAAESSSKATNGPYTGGDAGTVVIDIPMDSTIGNPTPGSRLLNVSSQSNGAPIGGLVYWTAPVDRAPDIGHGAPFMLDTPCSAVKAAGLSVGSNSGSGSGGGGGGLPALPNTSAAGGSAAPWALSGSAALLLTAVAGRRRRRRRLSAER